MTRDPFDEFKKFEKMFRRALEGGAISSRGGGRGISIQRIGDEIKVHVRGDVSKEEIKRLKRKYPDAEIRWEGKKLEGSKPVELMEEEEPGGGEKGSEQGRRRGPKIEEVDEEDLASEDLALKRFKEKKKNSQDQN